MVTFVWSAPRPDKKSGRGNYIENRGEAFPHQTIRGYGTLFGIFSGKMLALGRIDI